MFTPDTAPQYYLYLRSFETVPRSIAVEVTAAPVRDTAEIEAAIAKLGRELGGGLIVAPDGFTTVHVDDLTKSAAAGKPELFDLAAAHELYGVLFGPVEALIKDKRHVFMVPSGPLTALPFHQLVTEKPSVAVPQIKDIVAYRDAAWLVKRHAVTVLPSVTSLKVLRVFAGKDQGTKPMTGFGDPVFAPEQAPAAQGTTKAKIAAKTRAYSEYWRGSGVDRAKLREGPYRSRAVPSSREGGGAAIGATIHLDRPGARTPSC
jgi:hypothetical protein